MRGFGLTLSAIAWIALPLSLVWAWVALRLGRQQAVLQEIDQLNMRIGQMNGQNSCSDRRWRLARVRGPCANPQLPARYPLRLAPSKPGIARSNSFKRLLRVLVFQVDALLCLFSSFFTHLLNSSICPPRNKFSASSFAIALLPSFLSGSRGSTALLDDLIGKDTI